MCCVVLYLRQAWSKQVFFNHFWRKKSFQATFEIFVKPSCKPHAISTISSIYQYWKKPKTKLKPYPGTIKESTNHLPTLPRKTQKESGRIGGPIPVSNWSVKFKMFVKILCHIWDIKCWKMRQIWGILMLSWLERSSCAKFVRIVDFLADL